MSPLYENGGSTMCWLTAGPEDEDAPESHEAETELDEYGDVHQVDPSGDYEYEDPVPSGSDY